MASRTLPADHPVTQSDEFIAEALEHASVPALMLSMMHMSGDLSGLDGDIKPAEAFMGEIQGFMPPEQQAAVRAQALEVVKAYRDNHCELPEPPQGNDVLRMMNFITGDNIDPSYIEMVTEEMDLYGDDRRAFKWHKPVSDDAKTNFKVLVIGAGQSGVLAGIRLKQAGISYTIVEKNAGIGGTWYENSYPGARVDVPNIFYSYSFEQNHDWPQHFSRQPMLAKYFDDTAVKYGIKDSIQFETEVVKAQWDESNNLWQVTLREANGRERQESYNALISGVGQLNRQKYPNIEGREDFKGVSFHSSQWNHSIDLTGKRIAVIGTGASAFQLVPEIRKSAKHVTVFQRSPCWMFPNPNYHDDVSEGKKWLMKHLPYYARWYRFLHFWMMSDKIQPNLFMDPNWTNKDHSINEMNEMTRLMFTAYMQEQCGDDEKLAKQVIPTYPPLGKRTLQDNGSWLNALKSDNVNLVSEAATQISAQGVTDATGELHEVDIIVYATGFHANKFLWPMQITGKDGIDLHDFWGEDPVTNLGITTPNFPNLFCCYGPGNNLGHGGSLIFYSECQIRYALGTIRHLIENNLATATCTEDAAKAYTNNFEEHANRTVWAHPGMENWYRNSSGKVVTTSPWKLVDFWGWTKEPSLEDFNFE